MSDGDGNIIPHVEGDQGEGIKDFIDTPIFKEEFQLGELEKKLVENEEKATEKWKQDMEKKQEVLEKKLNRILIHLGLDDKSEILKI